MDLDTYYVLFFIHLQSRRVSLAGLTTNPMSKWMLQMARNATDDSSGVLLGVRFLLPDWDTKLRATFVELLRSSAAQPLTLPPRSPNLNAFAERWVCSRKQECLSRLIPLGESSLRRALNECIHHHHFERNHQGRNNHLLLPAPDRPLCPERKTIRYRERLGGLLKFHSRAA